MEIKKIVRVEKIERTRSSTTTSRDTARNFREALKDAAKRSKNSNDGSKFDQFIRGERGEEVR